ncbi:MAG: retropepsin-like aspartic protease [Pseudomonadota bacterium]
MAIITAAQWSAWANVTLAGAELASVENICTQVDAAIRRRLKRTLDRAAFTVVLPAPMTPVVLLTRWAPIDPAGLVYDGQATTANGTVRTASIRLPQVAFGPYLDQNFPAYVNEGQLDASLLGMDYLKAFRVELDGNRMTLSRTAP